MKFLVSALAILATMATVNCHPKAVAEPASDVHEVDVKKEHTLGDDVRELFGLFPLRKILLIMFEYISDDTQVQEITEFILSDEVGQMVYDIEAEPEYKAFVTFMDERDVDIYRYLNLLHSLLGLDDYVPLISQRKKTGTGLRGFVDDVFSVIPVDEVVRMYKDKAANSPEFQELIEELKSDATQSLLTKLCNHETFVKIEIKVRSFGIDVDAVKQLLIKLYGWKFPRNM